MSETPQQDLANLRPQTLKDYIGQENVRKTLDVFIEAVKNIRFQ